MGWYEPEIVCMKHPDHKQQPGVCSCCLRERLSKLSNSSAMAVSSSSPTYYYSSESSTSTYNSPPHRGGGGHHRIASDVLISFSYISKKDSSVLKKSRSIAFAAIDRVKDGVVKGKKKRGFWSKLLKRVK